MVTLEKLKAVTATFDEPINRLIARAHNQNIRPLLLMTGDILDGWHVNWKSWTHFLLSPFTIFHFRLKKKKKIKGT